MRSNAAVQKTIPNPAHEHKYNHASTNHTKTNGLIETGTIFLRFYNEYHLFPQKFHPNARINEQWDTGIWGNQDSLVVIGQRLA